jgi:hypothetical protein
VGVKCCPGWSSAGKPKSHYSCLEVGLALPRFQGYNSTHGRMLNQLLILLEYL